MILLRKVSKNFNLRPILKEISFDIKKGELVGFLGPNGSGKTTLMRIITGFFYPSSGGVFVRDYDVLKNSLQARKHIGYLPENPPLYYEMRVQDYLRFAAQIKDVPAREIPEHVDRVLTECDLREVKSKTIGILSKGFKQRVGIAQAIIHDPEILILDEPTEGLDPQQILQVRQLIKKFKGTRTVLLSTHILSEIEQIAQRVMIINDGKIIADAPLEDLIRSAQDKEKIRIVSKGDGDLLQGFLKDMPGIAGFHIERKDTVIFVMTLDVSGPRDRVKFQILEKMIRLGFPIIEVKDVRPTLEEIFLKRISMESIT